ncbi:hypothetical protein [Ruficoccus sp. ZRK36]|uniref:hypothetical protein n=1 Tax=Ruficoccus sp. ZRK36 TaxID=2866311 RepID=UPI001C73088E|nr:hypothetical protein [Ruficoccus sp. ZRK36]QYY34913.1 hypothetical protein K0V07_11430 [Ruficoccus sp. ZRK36]
MGSYHNTAIVLGNLKEALLYYDFVIPMNFAGQFMGLRANSSSNGVEIEKFKEISENSIHELDEAFGGGDGVVDLYPPHLRTRPGFRQLIQFFDNLLFLYMVKQGHGDEMFKAFIVKLSEMKGGGTNEAGRFPCPSLRDVTDLFDIIVEDFELADMVVDCSGFSHAALNDDDVTNCISIPGVAFIDTEKLTIPEIMEFRRDKAVMDKMRSFRLFAYEQYGGKERAFIEDDIQRRLDEYRECVKSLGFETTIKTLTFLCDSKILAGALVTSAVSMLMGNSQLAIEAFSAGAVLELGKLTLEYSRQKNSLARLTRRNPISYIDDVFNLHEKP